MSSQLNLADMLDGQGVSLFKVRTFLQGKLVAILSDRRVELAELARRVEIIIDDVSSLPDGRKGPALRSLGYTSTGDLRESYEGALRTYRLGLVEETF